MKKSKQKKTIWMMYKVGRLIVKMYTSFADNFSENEVFWRQMAIEEKGDAELLRKLYQAEMKGAVQFYDIGINEDTLETFILYIERIMKRVEQNKMSEETAMELTLAIEGSLIQKNIFKCFTVLDAEHKDISARLDSGARYHFKRVKQMIARCADKFKYGKIQPSPAMGTGRLMPSYI